MNPKLAWIVGLALVAAVAVVAAQAGQKSGEAAMPMAGEMGMGGMMQMHQQMHGSDGSTGGHMGGMDAMHQGMGAMHARMTEIFEGTYDDLVQKRKDTGLALVPMIQTAEDFEVMKKHHARMDTWQKENGGMGCPMVGMMGEQQNP